MGKIFQAWCHFKCLHYYFEMKMLDVLCMVLSTFSSKSSQPFDHLQKTWDLEVLQVRHMLHCGVGEVDDKCHSVTDQA